MTLEKYLKDYREMIKMEVVRESAEIIPLYSLSGSDVSINNYKSKKRKKKTGGKRKKTIDTTPQFEIL